MLEFWKNEWKLFMEDLNSVRNAFSKVFGGKKEYLLFCYWKGQIDFNH